MEICSYIQVADLWKIIYSSKIMAAVTEYDL